MFALSIALSAHILSAANATAAHTPASFDATGHASYARCRSSLISHIVRQCKIDLFRAECRTDDNDHDAQRSCQRTRANDCKSQVFSSNICACHRLPSAPNPARDQSAETQSCQAQRMEQANAVFDDFSLALGTVASRSQAKQKFGNKIEQADYFLVALAEASNSSYALSLARGHLGDVQYGFVKEELEGGQFADTYARTVVKEAMKSIVGHVA